MKRVIFLTFVSFLLLLPLLFPIKTQAITVATTDSENITANTLDADMQMRTIFLFPDSEGGVLAIWSTISSSVSNIYAQRYNSSLNNVWTNDLTIAPSANLNDDSFHAVADGSGGAVIVWTDSRNSETTDLDIYAQHIDKDGAKLWGGGDKVVSAADKIQILPDVYRTANGDYYFAWKDCRNNPDAECNGDPIDAYGQRLDSSGTAQWTENGISIASDQGTVNPTLYPNQNSAVDMYLNSSLSLFKITQAGSVTSEAFPQFYDGIAKDSSFNIIGLYTDVDNYLKLDKFNENDMTDMVWGSSVDTLIDTNYLNDWSLYLDSSDNVYVGYADFTNDEDNSFGDVLVKKFLSSGTAAWSGNATTVLQTVDDDSLLSFTDAGNNALVLNSFQDPEDTTTYLHMHTIDTSTGSLTAHSANPYFTHQDGTNTEIDPLVVSVYNNSSLYTLFEDEGSGDMNNLWLYLNTISADSPSPTPTPSPESSQSFSPPGVLGCNDSKPIGQPFITKVEYNGKSATISFAPAIDSFNKYHIAYGQHRENPPYALEYFSSAKGGIEKVDINYLTPGLRYFFKIKAGNGCNFGEWSAIYPTTQNSIIRLGGGVKESLQPEINKPLEEFSETNNQLTEVALTGSLFWQQIASFFQIVVVKIKGLFR